MNFKELTEFTLKRHGHSSPEDGLCAMEAVAWLEGLPHSDAPECTCPVIAMFVRLINDYMGDIDRQRLIPYLPKLVGTYSLEHEKERSQYIGWQVLTTILPSISFTSDTKYLVQELKELNSFDWETANKIIEKINLCSYNKLYKLQPDPYSYYYYNYIDWGLLTLEDIYTRNFHNFSDYWAPVLEILDGVLEIGPKGIFSQDITLRVKEYKELVNG